MRPRACREAPRRSAPLPRRPTCRAPGPAPCRRGSSAERASPAPSASRRRLRERFPAGSSAVIDQHAPAAAMAIDGEFPVRAIREEVVQLAARRKVAMRDVVAVEVDLVAGMLNRLLDVLEEPGTEFLIRDLE